MAEDYRGPLLPAGDEGRGLGTPHGAPGFFPSVTSPPRQPLVVQISSKLRVAETNCAAATWRR